MPSFPNGQFSRPAEQTLHLTTALAFRVHNPRGDAPFIEKDLLVELGSSSDNAQLFIAALNVERAVGHLAGDLAGGVAGLAVQPAAWYVTGTGPDAADAFIYGTGFAALAGGALLAGAGTVAGFVKAGVDDYVSTLVADARLSEPEAMRSGICATDEFDFWASNNHTTAMRIANKGGVAWKHSNGVYVYIKDNEGLPICDYAPQSYVEIYRPKIPLQRNGTGVLWTGI